MPVGRDDGIGRALSRWAVPPLLDRAASWAWRIVVVTAAAYIVIWLVGRLQIVVVAVFAAVVLASALDPPVSWLTRRGLPRLAATWLALLAALGAAGGVLVVLVPRFVDQLEVLSANLDSGVADARRWLETGPLHLEPAQVDGIVADARDRASDLVGGAVAGTLAGVGLVTEILTGVLLAIVLTFLFTYDGHRLWGWLVDRVRPERREVVDTAGRQAARALRGWARGVAVTGLIDAVAIGIGLVVLGVPLAFALSVLTFFAAFIPIVGAVTAGALAVVIALLAEGPGTAVLTGLLVLVVQQLEGQVILPSVMSRSVALHPAVILVVLAIGGAVAGIAGAVMAVPFTAAGVAIATAVASVAERDRRGPA